MARSWAKVYLHSNDWFWAWVNDFKCLFCVDAKFDQTVPFSGGLSGPVLRKKWPRFMCLCCLGAYWFLLFIGFVRALLSLRKKWRDVRCYVLPCCKVGILYLRFVTFVKKGRVFKVSVLFWRKVGILHHPVFPFCTCQGSSLSVWIQAFNLFSCVTFPLSLFSYQAYKELRKFLCQCGLSNDEKRVVHVNAGYNCLGKFYFCLQ